MSKAISSNKLTKVMPRSELEFMVLMAIMLDLPNDFLDEGVEFTSQKPYISSSKKPGEQYENLWELGGPKIVIRFKKHNRKILLSKATTEHLRELHNLEEFNEAYKTNLILDWVYLNKQPHQPYLKNKSNNKEVSMNVFIKYIAYQKSKKGIFPPSYFNKLHMNYFANNFVEQFKTTKEKQFGHEYKDIPRIHNKIIAFIMDTLAKNVTNAEKEIKDSYYQFASIFTKQILLIHYKHYETLRFIKNDKELNNLNSFSDIKFKDPKNHNLELKSRKADLFKDFFKRFKLIPEDLISIAQKNKKKGVGVRGKTNWGDMERA